MTTNYDNGRPRGTQGRTTQNRTAQGRPPQSRPSQGRPAGTQGRTGGSARSSAGAASGYGTRSSSGARSTGLQKAVAQRKAAQRRRKYVIFGVEIVLLAVMVGVLFIVFRAGGEGPGIVELPTQPEQLAIPSEVQEEMEKPTSTMKGYWNIALFGLDAQTDAELVKGGRSDSTMIASINLDTGDIKLVSVYRDTYLNTNPNSGDDYYTKCNAAYHYGGGERAVRMLNANLDMNITDFVAIGYKGLEGVINGVGGVYLDVDDTELLHINNYQWSIIKERGGDPDAEGAYIPVTSTGYQKLNGLQAAAYCRIRYRDGYDFARAAVQREVLKAIEEQAKKADLATLEKVFNETMKNVVTSLEPEDVLPYLSQVANFRIADEGGFPQEGMRGDASMSGPGLCLIPLDLESNVIWLHQFLFGDENYSVSQTVKDIGAKIKADTADRLK